MRKYNSKRKLTSDPNETKTKSSFVPASSQPATVRRHSPPSAAPGRPPSSLPSPTRPPATTEELHIDLALTSDESSTDDYFVLVDEPVEDEAVVETNPEPAEPTAGRKPVRPRKPPTVRGIRTIVSVPEKITRSTTQPDTFRRRRKALTAEGLAKSAANYSKSTRQLTEELAERMSLTPTERKRCQDLLRGMRVAQRHLCKRIRQKLLLDVRGKERRQFLGWLESTVAEIEGRSNDELE